MMILCVAIASLHFLPIIRSFAARHKILTFIFRLVKLPIPFILLRQRSCRTPWTNLPRSLAANTNCLSTLVRLTRNRFLYLWAPAQREEVFVVMVSGAEVAQEGVDHLTRRGAKFGVLKVRLYRPFSIEHFMQALPPTVEA